MNRAILVVFSILVLAACSSDGGYQGGGRGAPGSAGNNEPAVSDDLGGTELPPDPAFDDDTEDPPADPE